MVNVANVQPLPEADEWRDVPRLENGMWPTGGAVDPETDSGLMNWQAQVLAGRSKYLRTRLDALLTALANSLSMARLRLTATDGVALAGTAHALQIGPTNGPNLVADPNEVQARNNGAATGLYLNQAGGDVVIGTDAAALHLRGAVSGGALATQPEAEAGLILNKLMTPLRVAQYVSALFARSVAGNGYMTLPGGLIIQWLIVSVQSGDTSVTASLPISYPGNHRGAIATRLSDLLPSTSDVCAVGVSSQSSVTLRRAAAPSTIASYFVLSIGW